MSRSNMPFNQDKGNEKNSCNQVSHPFILASTPIESPESNPSHQMVKNCLLSQDRCHTEFPLQLPSLACELASPTFARNALEFFQRNQLSLQSSSRLRGSVSDIKNCTSTATQQHLSPCTLPKPEQKQMTIGLASKKMSTMNDDLPNYSGCLAKHSLCDFDDSGVSNQARLLRKLEEQSSWPPECSKRFSFDDAMYNNSLFLCDSRPLCDASFSILPAVDSTSVYQKDPTTQLLKRQAALTGTASSWSCQQPTKVGKEGTIPILQTCERNRRDQKTFLDRLEAFTSSNVMERTKSSESSFKDVFDLNRKSISTQLSQNASRSRVFHAPLLRRSTVSRKKTRVSTCQSLKNYYKSLTIANRTTMLKKSKVFGTSSTNLQRKVSIHQSPHRSEAESLYDSLQLQPDFVITPAFKLSNMPSVTPAYLAGYPFFKKKRSLSLSANIRSMPRYPASKLRMTKGSSSQQAHLPFRIAITRPKAVIRGRRKNRLVCDSIESPWTAAENKQSSLNYTANLGAKYATLPVLSISGDAIVTAPLLYNHLSSARSLKLTPDYSSQSTVDSLDNDCGDIRESSDLKVDTIDHALSNFTDLLLHKSSIDALAKTPCSLSSNCQTSMQKALATGIGVYAGSRAFHTISSGGNELLKGSELTKKTSNVPAGEVQDSMRLSCLPNTDPFLAGKFSARRNEWNAMQDYSENLLEAKKCSKLADFSKDAVHRSSFSTAKMSSNERGCSLPSSTSSLTFAPHFPTSLRRIDSPEKSAAQKLSIDQNHTSIENRDNELANVGVSINEELPSDQHPHQNEESSIDNEWDEESERQVEKSNNSRSIVQNLILAKRRSSKSLSNPWSIMRCDLVWPGSRTLGPIVPVELCILNPVIVIKDEVNNRLIDLTRSQGLTLDTSPPLNENVTTKTLSLAGTPLADLPSSSSQLLLESISSRHSNPLTVVPTCTKDSNLSPSETSRSISCKIRFRWLRGRTRTICTFHPHRIGALQCTITLRCFCSSECFEKGYQQLHRFYTSGGQQTIPKHPNPNTYGVPCRPFRWDDLDANREADSIHLSLLKEAGLVVTSDEDNEWKVISDQQQYTPTSSDVGHQLRFECYLEPPSLITTRKANNSIEIKDTPRRASSLPDCVVASMATSTATTTSYTFGVENSSGSEPHLRPFNEKQLLTEEATEQNQERWPSPSNLLRRNPSQFVKVTTDCVVQRPPHAPIPPLIELLNHSSSNLSTRILASTSRFSQSGDVAGQKFDRTSFKCSGSKPFSVMSWNILAEIYATQDAFPYCHAFCLSWVFRRDRILHQILSSDADIVCLQEVQKEFFTDFFLPTLRAHGYDGVYKSKTNEIFSGIGSHTNTGRFTVDGCATFFKTNRFRLIEDFALEFSSIIKEAVKQTYQTDLLFGSHQSPLFRRLLRDNIALLLVLEDLESNELDVEQKDIDIVKSWIFVDKNEKQEQLKNGWLPDRSSYNTQCQMKQQPNLRFNELQNNNEKDYSAEVVVHYDPLLRSHHHYTGFFPHPSISGPPPYYKQRPATSSPIYDSFLTGSTTRNHIAEEMTEEKEQINLRELNNMHHHIYEPKNDREAIGKKNLLWQNDEEFTTKERRPPPMRRRLIITNTHIVANPEANDAKIWQTQMLVRKQHLEILRQEYLNQIFDKLTIRFDNRKSIHSYARFEKNKPTTACHDESLNTTWAKVVTSSSSSASGNHFYSDYNNFPPLQNRSIHPFHDGGGMEILDSNHNLKFETTTSLAGPYPKSDSNFYELNSLDFNNKPSQFNNNKLSSFYVMDHNSKTCLDPTTTTTNLSDLMKSSSNHKTISPFFSESFEANRRCHTTTTTNHYLPPYNNNRNLFHNFLYEVEGSSQEHHQRTFKEIIKCIELPSAWYSGLLLVGDFNSTPESAVYELLVKGYCDRNHDDIKSDSYDLLTRVQLKHNLLIRSSYSEASRQQAGLTSDNSNEMKNPLQFEPNFTNFTESYTGCLDYIFFEESTFVLTGYRPLMSENDLIEEAESQQYLSHHLPSPIRPSDHLSLFVQFKWKN